MPPKPHKKLSGQTPFAKMQPILAHAARHLDEDVSLTALAELSGFSASHLQRIFAATIGESPKQITLRLRLEHAAAMLLTTGFTVLDIALDCGFQAHEVFCRAFRRRFGMTPKAYRIRGFVTGTPVVNARTHTAFISQVGPCIRLYHIRENGRSEANNMLRAITKNEIPPQPVLVVQRRIKPSEVAQTLAEVLGRVFAYAQQRGIPLAGQPLTRYLEWGPGLWTIEAGMRIGASPLEPITDPEIKAGTLPGGLVATTTHEGTYETLSQTHAAVQQWIEAQGLTATGAPWEVYTTDPADYPDPKDWKTDVFWPVARHV
jgi:AraC-like DNA-binding protein/effector-binding domain-containing protein